MAQKTLPQPLLSTPLTPITLYRVPLFIAPLCRCLCPAQDSRSVALFHQAEFENRDEEEGGKIGSPGLVARAFVDHRECGQRDVWTVIECNSNCCHFYCRQGCQKKSTQLLVCLLNVSLFRYGSPSSDWDRRRIRIFALLESTWIICWVNWAGSVSLSSRVAMKCADRSKRFMSGHPKCLKSPARPSAWTRTKSCTTRRLS